MRTARGCSNSHKAIQVAASDLSRAIYTLGRNAVYINRMYKIYMNVYKNPNAGEPLNHSVPLLQAFLLIYTFNTPAAAAAQQHSYTFRGK